MEPHPEQEDHCSGSLLQSCILLIVFNRKNENKYLGGWRRGAIAAHSPYDTLREKMRRLARPLSLYPPCNPHIFLYISTFLIQPLWNRAAGTQVIFKSFAKPDSSV